MAEHLIPLTEAHSALLESRGISAEKAAELGWQTCADRKGDWIAIPFHRGGKIVNWKYRTISGEKKFSQMKGGEQCFYNIEAIEAIAKLPPEEQRQQTILIVEGEMDCVIALQCGYLAVSVPSGAPASETDGGESAKFSFVDDFPRFAIAVLAVDDDPAGQVLRKELALRLGWHRCKWSQYPKGCKDLNDIFMKYRDKGIRMVLDQKTHFMSEGGLFTMSQMPAIPELPTYPVPIGNIAQMIKLRAQQFISVTGIPSMGKSLFVNCLAASMAKDYGWKVCIASFEDEPRDGIQEYLRKFYSGRQDADDLAIMEADAWIDRHFSFIQPDLESDDMTTLKWLLSRMRAAITQHGAKLLIIDPWNEIDHDRPMGMSLTEYTGFAIKELKRLAKRYMVVVLVVAHPAKPEKNKDGGYNVPTLYDISDSSHWYNKSDIGIIVHRYEGETDGDHGTLIRVAKIKKWGVMGMVGDRFLQYIPYRGAYIDYPDFLPRKTKKETQKKAKAEEEPTKQKGLDF